MVLIRAGVVICLAVCFPALYADDVRVVDGKKCLVKKRAKISSSDAGTAQPSSQNPTTAVWSVVGSGDSSLRIRQPIPVAQVANAKSKRAFATTTGVPQTIAARNSEDQLETESEDSLEDDIAQSATQQDVKTTIQPSTTAHQSTKFTFAETTTAKTTTEDSKGQFMDSDDFDSDEDSSSNPVTAAPPPHQKRDFKDPKSVTTDVSTTTTTIPTTKEATTSVAPTTTTTAAPTTTAAKTALPVLQKLLTNNKSKNKPLVEAPWVGVKAAVPSHDPTQAARTMTTTSTTTTVTTTTASTEAATTAGDTDATEQVEEEAATDVTTEEPTTAMRLTLNGKKASMLSEQQRMRLLKAESQAENSQAGVAITVATMTSSTTTKPTTTSTTVAVPTTQEEEETTSKTTSRRTTTTTTGEPVQKREEVAAAKREPDDGRSIRGPESDSKQTVAAAAAPQALLAKSLQLTNVKLGPSVDKGVNTTGMLRVAGPDSPLIDGSYLSDPWMCRVKRDVIKSPVVMETCSGKEKKQIVDLRVYKLVGIPTEECVTEPVVLGDRCSSLNGGNARCAQRYVRYGLIAQDLDSDKKGHECFRFPSACLCQLIVGDVSPLPAPDAVASATG
ncbi:hypothetical protein BV898_10964 [Hypsibius exemplaris]|uniref:Spaetzle domain-containing protein n=1 Tax=Hypsibius exemplaris TaxID=2072580 RepID=A0A1W0WI11_HYPEX|nr:hypothetical protein BV898_10964 [Hypsibius exemplaris]